jgi:nucleoside-diphosphate-sugar epimerase
MKILITGGNGYIAKSIYNNLKSIYDITLITRKECELTNFLSVNSFFQDKYFDVIIHCAVDGGSRLKEDNINVLDNNLKMYYNLLEQRTHYGKFIHFGSGAQFRSKPGPYGLSKSIIAESMLNKECFYNIIIYAIFDENELDTRFIKANIKKYINKESMIIHNNKKMTFFYMKDLVKLVEYIILEDPARLIKTQYASYVSEYSLKDIAEYIDTLADYKVPILIGTEPGEDYESKYNAPYKLNYIGLKEGIREVFNKLK